MTGWGFLIGFFLENTMLSRKHQTRAQPPLQNKINERTSADFFFQAGSTALSPSLHVGDLRFDSIVLEQNQVHTREQQEDNLDEPVLS